MPVLTTCSEVAAHLRAATRGRDRVLVITDQAAGQAVLTLLAFELVDRGVPAEAIDRAAFTWLDTTTGVRAEVAFLIVPKSQCPPGWFRSLATARPAEPDEDRDLILLGADPERLAGLLVLARDGRLFEAGDPARN